MATHSIGTSSRDYSTITSWEADLDSAGAGHSASSNAIGEMYDDSDFTSEGLAGVTIDGGSTIGLASITLRPASGAEHDGVEDGGVRILYSSGTLTGSTLALNSDVASVVCDIEIDWSGNGGSGSGSINMVSALSNASGDKDFRRMLIHGGAGTKNIKGMKLNGSAGYTQRATSCLVYDIGPTNTGKNATGIDASSSRPIELQGNTVHDIDGGSSSGDGYCYMFNDDSDTSLYNNLAGDVSGGGSTGCFEHSSPSNANASHNLSTDTTAPGASSVISQATSNLFTDATGPTYDFTPKAGAGSIDVGTDRGSGNEVENDITRFDRNSDTSRDPWDIGAFETVASGGGGESSSSAPMAGANF